MNIDGTILDTIIVLKTPSPKTQLPRGWIQHFGGVRFGAMGGIRPRVTLKQSGINEGMLGSWGLLAGKNKNVNSIASKARFTNFVTSWTNDYE